jgi:Tfp pilus assembly protein PilX
MKWKYKMWLQKKNKLSSNQQGFASIVVALIFIIVLALLTVGFAQLSRREQQTALDKQLSDQAFYAAESGINDAYYQITSSSGDINSTTTGVDTDNCLSPSLFTGHTDVINSTDSVSYPCVSVYLFPNSLNDSPLYAEKSWSTAFSNVNNDGSPTSNPLGTLDVYWKSYNPIDNSDAPALNTAGGSTLNNNNLPTQSAWGNAPALLQLNVTLLNSSFTRADLLAHTFTYYLYPHTASNPSGCTGAGAQGQIICSSITKAGYSSGAQVGGLAGLGGSTTSAYLITVNDYYTDSSISINALDNQGTPINFEGSQVDIDSTGKAQDVLKRIAAVVPLNQPPTLPGFALEAQNICKRLQTAPGDTSVDPTNLTNSDGCTP